MTSPVSAPGPLRQRIARNSGFVVAGRVWSIAQWIIVTPFVLHHLGPERFGVWSLLFLLNGYLATFDLGLGASVVRFAARYTASRDWPSLSSTLSQITRLYLLLGVVWILGIFVASHWILAWLRIPPAFHDEVRFAIEASAITFAFANLVSVGVGLLNGVQRMDLASMITVGASIPQIAILVIGLQRGYGLYAVVWSNAANWILCALLTWFATRKVAPQARWPSVAGGAEARGWLGFSSIMQLVNAVNLSQLQVDKIFLTSWIGLAAVTPFELGFRVANSLQSLPVLALSPLIPAFAEIHESGDRARLRHVSRRATDLLVPGAILLAACAVPAAPLIVRAWVGGSYPASEILAQWMIAALCVSLLTGVASSAARGTGRPVMELVAGSIGLAVHLAASAVFIPRLGAAGAGPAIFVAMVVTAAVFLVRFHSWLGEPSGAWLLGPLARALFASLPALAAGWLVAARWPEGWRLHRAGLLAGASTSGMAAAVAFLAAWALAGLVRRTPAAS